jgi:hypothetical protein
MPCVLALHHTGEPAVRIKLTLLAYEASTPSFVFRWQVKGLCLSIIFGVDAQPV